MFILKLLITIIISYLLGAIPTAFIMGKILKGIDIREHGSGNVGATNAFRVLGKKAGTVTFLIDVLKGALAVAVIPLLLFKDYNYREIINIVCCISVVGGHIWTVFLNFKGGKGVATSCGAFLSLTPLATGITVVVWIIVFYIFRYVSLGSIISALALPVLIIFVYDSTAYKIFACVLGAIVVLKHKSNIIRLMNGTEDKIGKKTA